MATEFKIHIDLDNLPGQNEQAKEQLKSFNSGSSENASKANNKNVLKTTVATAGVMIAAKEVTKVAGSVVNYHLSSVGAKFGDTARQNQINNMMNVGGMATSIVGSTAGAVAGGMALGGPVGAAILGTITAITSVVSEVVNGMQRATDWDREQFKNNIDESRKSERLGLMKTDRNRK